MEFNGEIIEGVEIVPLQKQVDERGFLVETFRVDTLPEGLQPVMAYISYTEPEMGRGPHEHREQTDIFSIIGPGSFKIYLWDNRKHSRSYGNHIILFGGLDRPITLIIPPGVVHGYKNVSKTERRMVMVINHPDKLFAGWSKQEPVDEILHEDSEDTFYKAFLR